MVNQNQPPWQEPDMLALDQVSHPRNSFPVSPALDDAGGVEPPQNIPDIPSSRCIDSAADDSPIYTANFWDGILERFSGLSSEMIALLEKLAQDINRSAQELRDIRGAVDAGKKELTALRQSEREASVLKPQIEDLRLQKETLEKLIADQRNAWDEEKAKQDSEEREREENLKTLRQREEEEYRLIREKEQMQARQKFEEELEAMRQKSAKTRAAEETDILARESALKKKEKELSRLMQELEKFLSGLAGRKGLAAADPGASGPDSRFEVRDSRLQIS